MKIKLKEKVYTLSLAIILSAPAVAKMTNLEEGLDRWSKDGSGIVYCHGVPKGEVKDIEGIEYVSAGADKDFAAANYSTACTSNLTDMSHMKWPNKAKFNGHLDHWDTSNATSMRRMFYLAKMFNQPVSNFTTGKVKDMASMFERAESFNQPLSSFETKSLENVEGMFYAANSFNHPLPGFVSEKTKYMDEMLYGAADFDQDISDWCVPMIKEKPEMFDNMSGIWSSPEHQPVWGTCP